MPQETQSVCCRKPATGQYTAARNEAGRNSEAGRCLKFEFPQTLEWKMDDGRWKSKVKEVVMYKDGGKR